MGRLSSTVSQTIVPGAAREIDWFQGPNSGSAFGLFIMQRGSNQATSIPVSAKIGAGAEGALLMNALAGPIVNSTRPNAKRVVQGPYGMIFTAVGPANYSTTQVSTCAAYGFELAYSAAVNLDPTSCAGAWWSDYDGVAGSTAELRANVGGQAFGITMNSTGQIVFVAKNTATGVPVYTETALAWPGAVTALTKCELRVFSATGASDGRVEVRVNDILKIRANFGTIGLQNKYGTLVPGYTIVPVISNFQGGATANPTLYWRGLYGWAGPASDSTF